MKNSKSFYMSALMFRTVIAGLFTFPMFYMSLLVTAFLSYSGMIYTIFNFLFVAVPFGIYFFLTIPLRKHYETTYKADFNSVRYKFVYELFGALGVIAIAYIFLAFFVQIFLR